MFSLFNFSSISRGGGSADPICPYVRTPMVLGEKQAGSHACSQLTQLQRTYIYGRCDVRSVCGGDPMPGPGGGGHRPPAPNLAVLLTDCGQLILGKISKYDATRRQTFKAKMHKILLPLMGLHPRPR